MTTPKRTSPGVPVNPAGDADTARTAVAADERCAAPDCELAIGEHPPVNLPDVPDGPMRVFGLVAGNAACAYRIALAEATRCGSCGGDNRTCSHTRAAQAWTTRLRQVHFPLRSQRDPS